MTNTDQLLELAGKMKPCQYHPVLEDDSDPTRKICACKGTSLVPRYKSLRRVCGPRSKCRGSGRQYKFKVIDGRGKFVDNGPCPKCQGRGWMPVDDTDATLEAIQSLDALSAQLIIGKIGFLMALNIQGDDEIYRKIRERANTPNEALMLALFKADKEVQDA